MTDETIDLIIVARNRITDRTDDFIDLGAVDRIDAVLRDVPAGQRNDVDLLLGRPNAILYRNTERGIVEAMEREGQRREVQPTEAEMIAIVQEALTQPAIEY